MTGALLAQLEGSDAQERPLRPYQAAAIEMLRRSLGAGKRRPLLQAPTGWGKTRVAAEIVNSALAKNKRVVFVVPALTLIDQTLEAFFDDGVLDMGVIQGQHMETDWSRPVQIASVQTLARRRYPKADLVLVDEAHRWFEHYAKWMHHPDWERVPFIGLSATPWTKGLGKHYDDLIISATTQSLIEEGYLAPFRVFAPSHPDLAGVKTVAGDYHEGQLATVMNKAPLVADIVETWINRGENRPTLCFGVDRAHAKHIQQRFEAAGIPCGYQDAFTTDAERTQIKRDFHSGALKVVSNVGTLTTGVDWDVRCIILARPTKSEILFVQIIGRGLRTAPGKADCLILDHSDSHLRLGFVTDIQHESFDSGEKGAKKKSEGPLPKECPKCTYLRPARVASCPNCGFKPEVKNKIQSAEGELIELRPNGKERGVPAGYVKLQGRLIPNGEFYGQLKHYARSKNYSEGWAANQYRSKTGTWPNYYRDVADMVVSYEVQSWIKSRQIAWAKSKRKAEAADAPVLG